MSMISWDEVRSARGPVNPKDVVFPENCLNDGGQTERQLRNWMAQVQAATAKKIVESPEFARQFFDGFVKCPPDSVLEKLRELQKAKEDLISTAQKRLVYIKLAEFLSEKERFSVLIREKCINYQKLWSCEKTLVELSGLEIGRLFRVRREMEDVAKATTAFMNSMKDVPDSSELAAFVQFMCASWRTQEQQDIIKKRLFGTDTDLLVVIIHKIFDGRSEIGAWAREAADAAISSRIAAWQKDMKKFGVGVLKSMEKVQYDEWFSDAHQPAWAEIDAKFRKDAASIAAQPTVFMQALNNNWLLQKQLKRATQVIVLTLLKAIFDTTYKLTVKWSDETWKKLNQFLTAFNAIYCTMKPWSLNRGVISEEFLNNLIEHFNGWMVLALSIPCGNDAKKLESLRDNITKHFHEDIRGIPVARVGQGVRETIQGDLQATAAMIEKQATTL